MGGRTVEAVEVMVDGGGRECTSDADDDDAEGGGVMDDV